MSEQQPQKSFTIKQTAEILACSVPTIYRMINSEKLKTFQVNSDKRITAGEITRIQTGETV